MSLYTYLRIYIYIYYVTYSLWNGTVTCQEESKRKGIYGLMHPWFLIRTAADIELRSIPAGEQENTVPTADTKHIRVNVERHKGIHVQMAANIATAQHYDSSLSTITTDIRVWLPAWHYVNHMALHHTGHRILVRCLLTQARANAFCRQFKLHYIALCLHYWFNFGCMHATKRNETGGRESHTTADSAPCG